MNILPKGRSFTAKSGTKVAGLFKGRSSTANSGTYAAVLLRMDRCSSFPLLSHSLFSIWTDLKRSEKIPGASTWMWREWIWLTGPSGHHWNSPQGLNIGSIRVFDQIRDPDNANNLRSQYYKIETKTNLSTVVLIQSLNWMELRNKSITNIIICISWSILA